MQINKLSFGNFSGAIAGYDPGGNGGHGFALAEFEKGQCKSLRIETLENAEEVIKKLGRTQSLLALGIDTLAAWSTGPSGWRPADLWLRKKYTPILPSIVSPNGLYGSMGLNGMAVLASIRQNSPEICVTETHPKVLYWALTESKYNYSQNSLAMDASLSEWLEISVETRNDHEWDAVFSILAAIKGLNGEWSHDLFKEPAGETGRLVFPAGITNYWWPQ